MPDGAALNTEAMAATNALASKRNQNLFGFRPFFLHFFHFSFLPSESAMRGLPEMKRRELRIAR